MKMNKGKTIAYKRVSTVDQNLDRQLSDLKFDKVFIDKCSAKTINRPALTELRHYVRDDDIIYVHSIDRLARNLRDLHNLVHEFNAKNVTLHIVQFNLIFDGRNDALSNFLLNVIGSVAEFERALMKERQLEGIIEAKKRGVYKGRQPCFSDETAKIIYEKIKYGVSKAKIARQLGVSRQTIYNYAK